MLAVLLSLLVELCVSSPLPSVEERLAANYWRTTENVGSGAVEPLRNVAPSPRAFHSMTGIDGRLFVFGGLSKDRYDESAYYRNDLHFFDTNVNKWSGELTRNYTDHSGHHSAFLNTPSPRAYHGATSIDEKLWIFGGNNNLRFMHEIEYFDTNSFTWSGFINARGPIPSGRSEHCFVDALAGHTPTSARHSSAFVTTTEPKYTRNRKLFVFGGRDRTGRALNDLWMYDIENNAWTPMETSGESPDPRHSMSCRVINPGADYDDLIQEFAKFIRSPSSSSSSWSGIESMELIVPNRPTIEEIKQHFASSPEPYPTEYNVRTSTKSLLFVHGGADLKRKRYFDDLYVLELDGSKGDISFKWKKIYSKAKLEDVEIDVDDDVDELYQKHLSQLYHATEAPNHQNYPRYRHHMLYTPGKYHRVEKFSILSSLHSSKSILNFDDLLFNKSTGTRIMTRMTPQGHVPTDFVASLLLPVDIQNNPMTIRQAGSIVIIDGTMGAIINELKPSDRIMNFDISSKVWARMIDNVHGMPYYGSRIAFDAKVGSAVVQIGQSVFQFGGLINGTAVDGVTSPGPVFPIEIMNGGDDVTPVAHYARSKCTCDLSMFKLTPYTDFWLSGFYPCKNV